MESSFYNPAMIDSLNRLLRILTRSLPIYMEDARPWSAGDDVAARTALWRVASDFRTLARRVALAILDHGGQPSSGTFPVEFGSLNDVSLDYLLGEVIERLRCEVELIERCAIELKNSPDARALAEEILGNCKGHLDQLAQLT